MRLTSAISYQAAAAGSFCVAFLVAGCGDSLATEAYRGEPRIVLRGSIESLERTPAPGEQIFVTVVWSSEDPSTLRENIFGTAAPITATTFPAQFEAALFDEPPAEAQWDLSLRNCPASLVDALEAEAPLYRTALLDQPPTINQPSSIEQSPSIDQPASSPPPQTATPPFEWPLGEEVIALSFILEDPEGRAKFPQQRAEYPALDSLGLFPSSVDAIRGYADCNTWALALQNNPQLRQSSTAFQGSVALAEIVVFADKDGNGRLSINNEIRDEDLFDSPTTGGDEELGKASRHTLAYFQNVNDAAARLLVDGPEPIRPSQGSALPRNGFQILEDVCRSPRLSDIRQIVPAQTAQLTIFNEADRDRLYLAQSLCAQ